MSYTDKHTSNNFYDPTWVYILTIREQHQMLEKQSETLAKFYPHNVELRGDNEERIT